MVYTNPNLGMLYLNSFDTKEAPEIKNPKELFKEYLKECKNIENHKLKAGNLEFIAIYSKDKDIALKALDLLDSESLPRS